MNVTFVEVPLLGLSEHWDHAWLYFVFLVVYLTNARFELFLLDPSLGYQVISVNNRVAMLPKFSPFIDAKW